MRGFAAFWAEYRSAIELAFAQQFVALFVTSLILDGGQMFRATLFTTAAHWVAMLTVIVRRPFLPTRFDLDLIRYGFIPVGIVAGIIASLLGRTI